MKRPVDEAIERAEAMLEHGLGGRAIATLEAVLFDHPEDPRLLVQLAELYVMSGDDLSAASYYLGALKLEPGDAELQIRMSAILEAARKEIESLAASSVGLPGMRRRKAAEVPTIRLDEFEVSADILALVPRDLATRFRVVPVARAGETLVLATAQPENRRALEEVAFVTDLAVNCVVATDEEITSALKRFYGAGKATKKKR